jgi:hypothetical protein
MVATKKSPHFEMIVNKKRPTDKGISRAFSGHYSGVLGQKN